MVVVCLVVVCCDCGMCVCPVWERPVETAWAIARAILSKLGASMMG